VAGARWTALAVVAALSLGAAGCGDSGTDVEKVALVAPVSGGEADWTQQARAALEQISGAPGLRVDTVDASQTDDLAGLFGRVADEGNQLVVANDGRYADAAAAAAAEADVPTLVWGERDDDDAPVAGVTLQDKEGGYMAGIVAAMAAVTRRLGIVVVADGSPWEIATWNRMAGGFVAGARSADPGGRVTYARVDSDGEATVAEVHDAAERLLDDGAQMIFALGGRSTVGALRAVEEESGEAQFVGVVGDKAAFNRENMVLTSVMWDPRRILKQAVRDVRAGSFGERPYRLTIRNRGIWLFSTGRTPLDAYEAAIDAGERIARGKIDVPVTATSQALEQLLASDTGR
jgi:basic membrane protein A and related proteins